ncbi:MFS transporter [Sphingomonas sp. CD22]|uniref:spinster family MFS transporter n=1 Tax=Sphingomonas sp. CD22 TaxID=3100214 RepID=UPI002ADFB46E|nr:MFS transporter [Sphingomonas sp. CD22]MEA1086457.1 MFS transporter [Sphingomonas sp. CD22]
MAVAHRRTRLLVLAMLLLVYTFNFLDRQILGMLAAPIKAELHLTDTQLGALGGIAFALLYSTLAIPLALVADRTSRSWVITISLAIWSLFTALCGLATGFWQLFACRLGVGVGEAGGVAPSYAMIADSFPPRQRGRALAIYSLGIPIGMAAGALLGGVLASAVDWRRAFLAVGIAGLILAPIFRWLVTEPARGRFDPHVTIGPGSASTLAVFELLAGKPSFWLMAFAASCSSLAGYGLAFWMPSVLIRSFGFTLLTASQYLAALLLVGGTIGVFAGGWLADRLGRSDRGVHARLPAIAWLITAPLFAAGLNSASPTLAWLLFLIPHGLNILWLAPVTNAVQHLVPPPMRATAAACFLFINNLIGLGLGSLVMGRLSDAMTAAYGSDALRHAALAALAFYPVAALLMLLAVRPLRRDWVG